MINWKKVGEEVPTNKGKYYNGSECTPFVVCLVWIVYDNSKGNEEGVPCMAAWDTRSNKWHTTNIFLSEFKVDGGKITHFCDDINIPNAATETEKKDFKSAHDTNCMP